MLHVMKAANRLYLASIVSLGLCGPALAQVTPTPAAARPPPIFPP